MPIAFTRPFGNPSEVPYPVDSVLGFTSVQAMSMPAYRTPVIDPTFNNSVIRICDQAAFATSELPLTHNYAKTQVWNADESLILLDWFWGRGRLIDGVNYKYLRQINIPNGRHSGRWSNVNPDNLYGIVDGAGDTSTTMVVTHPLSDTSLTPTVSALHTFSQFDIQMSFGMEEGNFANDDSMGAVIGWSNSQAKWGICTFAMTNLMTPTPTITEIATFWLPNNGGTRSAPNWDNITVSPYGDAVLVQYTTSGTGIAQGIWWYSANFTSSMNVTASGGHWDVALDYKADPMVVTVGGANGIPGSEIAAVPIDSNGVAGPGVNLLTFSSLQPNWHISGRNIDRPGWVYLSDMSNNPAKTAGFQQIFALKMDQSQKIEVYGCTHGSQNVSTTDNTYTARGVPNRNGTRIVFDSDWGGGTSSPAYDYVMMAPLKS
jgi:hypothetical protein